MALLGTAVNFVGVAGTFYCRHYLGRFWTAETTLLSEHNVVDSGPYGVVRHPIYAFALLMYLGTALVFPTWWDALASGLVMLAYALKANDEDRFLTQSLPGYRDYQDRVPYRLIPWIW